MLNNGNEDVDYILNATDLLTGYTDADNDAIEVFGITSTSGLISNNNDGTFTFKPNPDISGEVTLEYVVRDQFGGNTLASIKFNLEAVNDKPIRTGGNFSTLFFLEDQDAAPVGLQDLNYNPGGGISEEGQTLTYTITTLPDAALGQIGSLNNDADGKPVFSAITEIGDVTLAQLQQMVFNPAAEASGQASFSFSVTDSGTEPQTISETVNITILNFNDAPILPTNAITLTDGTEDTAYNFTAAQLLAGVTDPDINYAADGVTVVSRDVDNLQVTGLTATNGTITFNSNTDFTFTPDANFNGIANFNYSISDGTATVSNSVALNIVAVNDAPDATFDVAQITTEGNAVLQGTLSSYDVDAVARPGGAADQSDDDSSEGDITTPAFGDDNNTQQAGTTTPTETASYSLLSASIADSDGNAINDPTTNEPVAVQGLTISADGSWSFNPLNPPTTLWQKVRSKPSPLTTKLRTLLA